MQEDMLLMCSDDTEEMEVKNEEMNTEIQK